MIFQLIFDGSQLWKHREEQNDCQLQLKALSVHRGVKLCIWRARVGQTVRGAQHFNVAVTSLQVCGRGKAVLFPTAALPLQALQTCQTRAPGGRQSLAVAPSLPAVLGSNLWLCPCQAAWPWIARGVAAVCGTGWRWWLASRDGLSKGPTDPLPPEYDTVAVTDWPVPWWDAARCFLHPRTYRKVPTLAFFTRRGIPPFSRIPLVFTPLLPLIC